MLDMALPKDNKVIERFLSHCHRRHYPNKSVIIYAGDVPDVLYYIIEGSVTVLIEDTDGKEIVLAYLNPGDFFGEMGLFDPETKRTAWVRARTECELGEISYTKFRQLSQEYPDVLFELSSQMAMRLHRAHPAGSLQTAGRHDPPGRHADSRHASGDWPHRRLFT